MAVDAPVQRVDAAPRAVTWRRTLLLVALLNAPLFFDGCDTQRLRFSVGMAIPCGEIESDDQRPSGPFTVIWWSWTRCLANGLVLWGGIWLATRRVRWIRSLAETRWFVGLLVAVAVAFNSWLIWPTFWAHAVFNPTLQLWALGLVPFGGLAETSETTQRYVLLLSSRLYYFICVAGLSVSFVGLRAFLRRFFFVRAGPWWQIQLRGLIIVMVVLGAVIGMAVRLLTLQ